MASRLVGVNVATLPVASTVTEPGRETQPPGLLTSHISNVLVLIVVRFIGALNTAVKLLLIGTLSELFGPGLKETSVGAGMVAACTVKPPGTFSTSPPVVVTTFTGPSGAPLGMLIVATSVVALLATVEPTVIPVIACWKVATVVPLTQLVYCPLMVTCRDVCPGLPKFGLIWVMIGVPAVTVNPLLS